MIELHDLTSSEAYLKINKMSIDDFKSILKGLKGIADSERLEKENEYDRIDISPNYLTYFYQNVVPTLDEDKFLLVLDWASKDSYFTDFIFGNMIRRQKVTEMVIDWIFDNKRIDKLIFDLLEKIDSMSLSALEQFYKRYSNWYKSPYLKEVASGIKSKDSNDVLLFDYFQKSNDSSFLPSTTKELFVL